MADRVSRTTIARLVIEKLKAMSEPGFAIKESHRLQQDLDMGPTYRAGMALPYSRICGRYKGDWIRISEARALKTVKASIDLVHERANS